MFYSTYFIAHWTRQLSDSTDLILVSALAVGGFFAYQHFFGSNPEASQRVVTQKGDSTRKPTPEEKAWGGVAGKSVDIVTYNNAGTNTTYFWTQEDYEKLPWWQRTALNIGIPHQWVLE
jgi:hypothetical protein